jgi:hypothetical protein
VQRFLGVEVQVYHNEGRSMKEAVDDALRLLFVNDIFLLESDVAERTIAAKLACYLAPHFHKHSVDVEYNRHGLDIKRVDLPEAYRGDHAGRIYPDVIVHTRGNDEENLLVIQIKKSTNRQSRDYDRAVIEAMKRDFKYRSGLLLDLPAGPEAKGSKHQCEWL